MIGDAEFRAAEGVRSQDQLPSVSVVICAFSAERWDDKLTAAASAKAQEPAPQQVILAVDHNPALQTRFAATLDITVVENSDVRGLSGARGARTRTGEAP